MNGWLPDVLNIRSVRVDKALLRRILDALDKNLCRLAPNKRRHERLQYRGRQVILYTKQTERDVAFIVPTRNISRGGLSFLHGQMMHIKQPCCVVLAANDGNWLTVESHVVRCRHVCGMIHEIGLKFSHLINLADLRDLSGTDIRADGSAVDTISAEELSDLGMEHLSRPEPAVDSRVARAPGARAPWPAPSTQMQVSAKPLTGDRY